MRPWLGCSLLTVGLLASACADPPQEQGVSPFTEGSNTTGGAQGPTTGVDMPNTGMPNTTGGEMMPDGGVVDAGPQCIVAIDAARGFHCDYVNRVATGVLVPADSGLDPIKACKDFPVEVSKDAAFTACDALFPRLEGSIEVSAGPCDMTGAKGFCSDSDGGRDFTYHAACDMEGSATGDGSWACSTFGNNFGATGWTCLIDDTKSWGGDTCGGSSGGDAGASDGGASDGGTTPGDSCEELPTGDGKTYNCSYTNDFAGGVHGCKQYGGTWTEASAKADCSGLTQAKKGSAVFADGACATDKSVGYCLNTRKDREYDFGVYESGCGTQAEMGGAWACATFGIAGQDVSCASWVCDAKQPPRSCKVTSPTAGKPGCTNLPFNSTAQQATAACPSPATVEEKSCNTTNAVATCFIDGSLQVFSAGLCSDLRKACKGTFECLVDEPTYSCHKKDTGIGCRLGLSCSVPTWCVDYASTDGWTAEAAAANCAADKANPNNGGTTGVESTSKATTAESCEKTRAETTRCVVKVDGKDTRRYGEPNCSGTKEDVPPVTPVTCSDTGMLTCRYSSTFTANNCADFPTTECWTEADVKAHCSSQSGATANTVVVTKNNTCLAATPTVNRCKVDTKGKTWYAFGAPDGICTGSIGGTVEKPPHQPY